MDRYIDLIEKFLRGPMNQKEENTFKTSLATNGHQRSFAFYRGSHFEEKMVRIWLFQLLYVPLH